MTIDEAIKHCREVAEKKEKLANTYESFQDCGNSKSSLTSGREKCLKCAEEHKQLARWLEELKALKEQPSGDCISRAEAIKALEFTISVQADSGFDKYREAIKHLVNASYNKQKKAILNLPSVQPKIGHWIEYTKVIIPEPINSWRQAWKCSECGYGGQDDDEEGWLEWNYCPECGAKMEVEE